MPYIAIKAFPKDEATKRRVVEQINRIFLEEWGCSPQALTISVEEVAPEQWAEQVAKPEIEPKRDKMMILNGEKLY